MTPKEKAEELVDKYYFSDIFETIWYDQAKQCALIAVNEIIENRQRIQCDKLYWEQVKQEIQKL